ncbi:MAG: alpha/beta fold hydrolase [Rhodobacteraceae bacterium]|nr:alpha/beta fold hydrolase [Paracoccaceae bacterium]
MRRLLRIVRNLFLLFVVLVAAIWLFGPREPVDEAITFQDESLGDDLDAYLAAAEAEFGEIVPGTEKRIVWAGAVGQKTPLAVVYLHGWSASAEEIRPVPDRVAAALGANLYFTRLSGHGRTGEALATATAGDWINDVAEAMAIGRRLGQRVLVIGTSTGGTLAADLALRSGVNRDLAGVVLISPNFRVRDPAAILLTVPFARWFVPLLAGKTRSWHGLNQAHERYWTNSYPTVATLPMAALVRHTARLDFSRARVPALFLFTMQDPVVDHRLTRIVASQWGGEVKVVNPPVDDAAQAHVIAGDIVSPKRTDLAVEVITDWAKGL